MGLDIIGDAADVVVQDGPESLFLCPGEGGTCRMLHLITTVHNAAVLTEDELALELWAVVGLGG
jgi:hypothetical protein